MITNKQSLKLKTVIISLTLAPIALSTLAFSGLPFEVWLGIFAFCVLVLVGITLSKHKALSVWATAGIVVTYLALLVLGVDFYGETFATNSSLKSFSESFLVNGQAIYFYYAVIPVVLLSLGYILLRKSRA